MKRVKGKRRALGVAALVWLMALAGLMALAAPALCASPGDAARAETLVRQAVRALVDGNSEKAVQTCSRAVELAPDYGMAYEVRAMARMNLGQDKPAYEDAKKAAELAPESWRSWLCLARAQRQMGLPAEAIKSLDRILELGEERPEVYLLRGKAHAGMGQYEKAIADYNAAIRLNPELPGPYNEYAWLLATCPDAKVRHGRKAVMLAEKAVDLNVSAAYLDTLAAAYARDERYEDAAKTQQRAIDWMKKIEGRPAPVDFVKRLKEYQAGQPWTEEKP